MVKISIKWLERHWSRGSFCLNLIVLFPFCDVAKALFLSSVTFCGANFKHTSPRLLSSAAFSRHGGVPFSADPGISMETRSHESMHLELSCSVTRILARIIFLPVFTG